MTSSSPEPGQQSRLQRLLPLILLGVSAVLIFQLFPQLIGGNKATPTPDTQVVATVEPSSTAVPAEASGFERQKTDWWNFLLVHPIEAGLRFLANDLNLGAGTAIILFTIIVRLVLLPLTIMQMRSQKRMQRLQPELKKLQKQYEKDKEKLGAETMALYKEHGVNPAAGCLPMLPQMPVLFALYAALNNLGHEDVAANTAFHQPWLWVSQLNHPDIFHLPGLGFPLPFVLPVLAAALQWVQQQMMTQPTDDPQQKMQNQMMQFMPLMMLWFGINVAAGLALYWVTQSFVGIVQQYFSTGWGSLGPTVANVRAQLTGGSSAGAGGGASGRALTARSTGGNGRTGRSEGASGGKGGRGGTGNTNGSNGQNRAGGRGTGPAGKGERGRSSGRR
jgi:YidC/Oxa1 family membrane protein insertase